jgi:hypothetical protein
VNRVQLTQSPPGGYSPSQQQSAFNARYAQALQSGDTRYQMKNLDRAGLSRGRGQQAIAEQRAAAELAGGLSAAYQQLIDDDTYGANMRLQGAAAQEQAGRALAALQQQQSLDERQSQLRRQQSMMNFAGSLLGGLLQ